MASTAEVMTPKGMALVEQGHGLHSTRSSPLSHIVSTHARHRASPGQLLPADYAKDRARQRSRRARLRTEAIRVKSVSSSPDKGGQYQRLLCVCRGLCVHVVRTLIGIETSSTIIVSGQVVSGECFRARSRMTVSGVHV